MHKPTKPFTPSLGSNLGVFAQEMFGHDSASPLKKSEIREGLARLMASPLMKSAEAHRRDDGEPDDYSGAADTACDFRSDAGPDLFDFAEKWGLEGQVPAVINELGFALLASRLTVEELFRLGTSPEAIRLFEEYKTRRDEDWDTYHAKKAAEAKAAEATS